jgi:hypothetical protein
MSRVLALLVAASACLPALAHAEPPPKSPDSTLCVDIPPVWVNGQPVTHDVKPCIPWI